MADAVECEYCGESFSPQGLPNHERHCQDDEEESVRNYTDVQKEALERDDRTCLECGHTDDVVVHTIWPEGKDQLGNYLTLCVDCDEEYEQYRPLTKRTKAWYRG